MSPKSIREYHAHVARKLATTCVSVGLLAGGWSAFASEQFLVIDVAAGKDANHYPVERLEKEAADGWGDEYKTDKIVLSKISQGTDEFYIGVFEVTQRQWELVTGARPSYYRNSTCYAKRPVENVSYDDIRGKNKGAEYPASTDVDADSFIGLLRTKAQLPHLDLPTRAQWELASQEPDGGTAANDPSEIWKRARIGVNPGYYLTPLAASPDCGVDNGTAEVGSYAPNGRGLYDMQGNVCEWCLDSCDVEDASIIWVGDTWKNLRPFGKYRVLKGSHCESSASGCDPRIVYGGCSSFSGSIKGFRLVCN